MEEIFSKAVARNEALKKTSVPWQPDEPHDQAFHVFDETSQTWIPHKAGGTAHSSSTGIDRLALYAWNIDFMLPYAESRMTIALRTLEDLLNSSASQGSSTTATVIFLQECTAPDLATIAATPWVRERFLLTDMTTDAWASGYYGTTTLVDKRLPLAALFRVHYAKTRMERDGLFVDVVMGSDDDKKQIRLCNTHLESLDQMPPFRPPQVALVARYLKADGVDAGIAAGDFNAIQDFDRALHSDNGLKDAYLERGGQEDSEDGYTWGQQAATSLRDRYGCSRMDKVFYRGAALELRGFERFGADVQLEDPEEREDVVDLGFDKPWITDHLGVKAEFELVKN